SDIPNGLLKLDSDGLGQFYVAMIDGSQAKDQIDVPGSRGGNINLGVGYEATENELPLVAIDQSSSLPKDAFQKNGGFALVMTMDFDHATGTDKNDKNRKFELRLTAKGSVLGGMERIYYDSFDGKALKNVTRGGSLMGGKAPPNFAAEDKASGGSGSGGG